MKASICWGMRNKELPGRSGWAGVTASSAPGLGLQGNGAML